MRIAFHAPLKPPTHPSPSGDRRMARLFMEAMKRAGHTVELASVLRTYDGTGDTGRQERMRRLGERMAARLVRRYRTNPPDIWLTYHLYYKAPDWLGPAVTRALDIPYVVAEASHAPKRADGPWAVGHQGVADAIAAAARVCGLNWTDTGCVLPLMSETAQYVRLPPFLDTAPYAAAADSRETHRADMARRYRLDPEVPWLLTVAMMRHGDKLASYRILREALAGMTERPWSLLVAGDGPARPEVAALFDGLGDRVTWLGETDPAALPAVYAAADLFVWPAVNEAYGMALLEAHAAGLPAVVGRTGGVPEIVRDGITGMLVPVGDVQAFGTAAATFLGAPAGRRRMGEAARRMVAAEHGLDGAARTIDAVLTGAVP